MGNIVIRAGVAVLAMTLLAAGAYLGWQSVPEGESDFALAEVRRGDLVVKTYLRGELRAVRSLTLTAPNIGSMSQITQLAPTGALAKRGNLLFELDDSERVAALEDTMLTVEQIKENLKKAEAELEIRKSQDEVEIVQANFQVRRAELEVQRNELLAEIDARKNELTLEEALRRKAKLEADIENRLRQREAELAVLREQLNKALIDVERDQRRIAESRVLSPLTGLVAIQQNRSGGRGGFGQSLPEIREGDQVYAGMPVAQLLDLSEMELMTRVEESERANLREGQEVLIRLDALSDKTVSGTIKRLGTTASANIFAGEATKKFECVIEINMRELLASVGAEPDRIDRIMATARLNAAVGYGGSQRAGARRSSQAGPADGPARAGANQPTEARGGQRGQRQGGQRQERASDQRGQQPGRSPRGAEGAQQAQAGQRQGGRQPRQGLPGGPQGQQAQPGQGGRGGAQGRGGQGFDPSRILSRLPEEVRSRAETLLKGRSPQDLSDEERQQFRQIMQAARGGGGGGQRQGGPRQGGQGGFGGRGGPGGFAPGGFGGPEPGGAGLAIASSSSASPSGFGAAARQSAQLPEPPQQGSDVDVLLRPGLLADAEVTVETIPDTLYVPYQAVFEEGPATVVYVFESGRLVRRQVELGRRSESQIAVVSGLAEGDQVSLYRPDDSAPSAPAQDSPPQGGPSFPGAGGSL